MTKPLDKDLRETLADMEFFAEMSGDDPDGDRSAARNVTVFRRVLREAGYEIPADFQWQDNLAEESA